MHGTRLLFLPGILLVLRKLELKQEWDRENIERSQVGGKGKLREMKEEKKRKTEENERKKKGRLRKMKEKKTKGRLRNIDLTQVGGNGRGNRKGGKEG